ncbi:MAG: transcriptional regulator [Actinomycetia bacterium]|jgi:ArsR family transcriptional regulator|nr:transcriptional regulator [Actinomycetes bacterium]
MMTSVDTDALKLLGDPLRAQIVSLLAREALCTCHIVEETGAKQTNVSNHLRALREAGLVETEPCGRFTYYRLRPEPLEALSARLGEFAQAARDSRTCDQKRPCP